MVNKYTIKIKNESGSQQHYALFNKPPVVTGRVQGQIWSNVFATGNTPKGSTANFSVYKQYYGVVGTSSGSPALGVEVNVSGDRTVELGSKDPNGRPIPGTTLELVVSDDAPQFSDHEPAKSGYINAFEVKTGTDFTVEEARNGNYIIGLGGSRSGNSNDGPAATFTPEPNVQYQIQPVNTYYVTVGDFTKGTLIDVTKIGNTTATIDFTKFPSGNVNIVHAANGQLNIQFE